MGIQPTFNRALIKALCSTIRRATARSKRCPLKKVAQGFIKLICHGMFNCCTQSEVPAPTVVSRRPVLSTSCDHVVFVRLGNRDFHGPSVEAAPPAPRLHGNNSFGGDEPRSRKLESSRIRQGQGIKAGTRPLGSWGHLGSARREQAGRGLRVEAWGEDGGVPLTILAIRFIRIRRTQRTIRYAYSSTKYQHLQRHLVIPAVKSCGPDHVACRKVWADVERQAAYRTCRLRSSDCHSIHIK